VTEGTNTLALPGRWPTVQGMARLWGKDPSKTGGSQYRADPDIADDQGPLTCGACQGAGIVTREHRTSDADDPDAKTDRDEKSCPTCGGEGKIR